MASTFIIMSVWVTFGMGATYNDTTVIQLGVIGNSSAFTGVSGFWTTSLPPSSQDEHNTLYRISLDTSQPFTILRHTRGIARVSDILLLSGHPIYINSTLRLLSDQIQTMGVYEALTASSSQFCRLQNASNPITQYSSLPYRSFGSHPRWTIVPLTCYHLSPVDPIISVLFWVKWKSIIIISDESAEGLPGALLSHLYDKDIMTLHQRLHVNTSAASINDLLLYHYNRKERHAPNFILLCGWPLVERIFKMVREMDDEKFTAMFFYTKWITVCRRSQLSVYGKLVNAMNNVLLVTLDAGLSPVILSDNVPWCKADAELWSSLGPSGRGPGGMSRLGCWFRHTGVIFTHDPFPNFGFNARLFRVGVFEWRPFIIENLTYGENYTGFCIDIVRNLAQALNFSYTFMTASDGESDAFAGNDSWKGIPRDIINGLLDFSIAPFAITGERELVLDFTYDYFTDYNVILTKRFTKENSWRLVIDIFSWPVIVVIVAAVPTTAIVIYVLEAWNPYPFPASYQSRGVGRLGQLVWYTYGALLSQGGSHIPVSQAGRTMVAFWWLFSIMLTATFSGNLIAFLTVPKSFVPFQSIESMVHQNQFSWGLSNTSSFFRFLQTTNITPYDAVWRGVRHQDFHQETHVDRVLRENYVYLGDKSGCLYHMTSHCELTVSKQEFFPLKYAIALPKGSPYNGIFSKKLSQMTESGLILKWRKKWWPPRNCPSKTTNAKKMTLGDVQSAFYLLIIGTVLGVIAVICEKIYSNVNARGRTKPPVEDKRLQRNERTKSVLCGCITGRFSAEVGSSNQAASSEDHMCSYADADRKSVSERDSIENGLGEVKTIA